jgi:hypothetical protein
MIGVNSVFDGFKIDITSYLITVVAKIEPSAAKRFPLAAFSLASL